MSQNRSSAVMQQRSEPHDSLDDFPTPSWATRALLEHVIIPQLGLVGRREIAQQTAWEPACNRGHMSRPLKDYFRHVVESDIHPYGRHVLCDFLIPAVQPKAIEADGAQWVITNPPFRLAEQFILRAREVKNWRGTAMIVRTAFLEGVGRFERLFALHPPAIVAQFTERVPMVKGRLTETGSTATAYCWLVWMDAAAPGTRMMWIPPCRRKLERPGDYPVSHRVPENPNNENAYERTEYRT